ncbi:protein FAF-like [Carex littledalei]|uniref:Protein FAF-like n=1 Tax=Carex littledalei TaxID=544730 RepID=A0A833VD28_9POAL|nr:protein FAF-like [Carex littledalei]
MPALSQVDIWAVIQSEFDTSAPKISKELPPPYVHPLVRRSSQLMSQKSLQICTENLGSETGAEYSSDESNFFSSDDESDESEFTLTNNDSKMRNYVVESKDLMTVNYHGCGGSSGGRTFPPPLPSIARRDGRPCVRMQPHRQDGRLVVQAVPVRSNTYLHANRLDGRLRLSFIDCASRATTTETTDKQKVLPAIEKEVEKQISLEEVEKAVTEEEEVGAGEGEEESFLEEEEEEEEEVEVVERRTVIEVKVGSTQNVRVHRSSLVINKFLGSTPDAVLATEAASLSHPMPPSSPPKRAAAATAATSAAAAVVAAASSSVTTDKEMAYGSYGYNGGDTKLLFTSRRRDKEELLSSVRRCRELRRPLFIWEPCCVATS